MQEVQAKTTAGMEFTVRRCRAEDEALIRELLGNLLVDKSLSYATDFDGALESLQPEFPPTENGVIAVAEHGALGWCHLVIDPRPQYRHVGALKLYYSSQVHGVGVGDPLLDKAMELARSLGLSRLEIRVNAERRGARALYRRIGFKEEGTLVGSYMAPDGSLHDEIVLGFNLNGDPSPAKGEEY